MLRVFYLHCVLLFRSGPSPPLSSSAVCRGSRLSPVALVLPISEERPYCVDLPFHCIPCTGSEITYATGGVRAAYPTPNGLKLKVQPSEIQANCAWGDGDGKTLYMIARTGLYRLRLNIEGIRPGPSR
jgi:hypothetical protein